MNEYSRKLNKISTDELNEKFRTWETALDNGNCIDELIKIVNEIILNLPFQCITQDSSCFYRARKHKNNSFFENKDDVWYPNKKYVTEIGRANRSGESKMYISQLPRVTLFEMHLNKGDTVTISKIGIKAGSALNVQFLSTADMKTQIVTDDRLKDIGLDMNGIKNYRLIHNFLSDEFTKEKKKWYPLSTAIAEVITSYENSDGLLYSSIQSKNDFNIVLKKEIADEKLELINSVCFEVINENEDGSIVIKDIAATSSIDSLTGEISWDSSLRVDKVWDNSVRFGMEKVNISK
jgi:hypothetical protein